MVFTCIDELYIIDSGNGFLPVSAKQIPATIHFLSIRLLEAIFNVLKQNRIFQVVLESKYVI